MFLLILLVVLVVLCYSLYYYFTRNYNYWKKQNVVGPEPMVFFGNLKETALRRENMAVAMQEIYKMFPKEKVIGIYRMTSPCLIIRDLDIIKQIMIKDFDLFKDRGTDFSHGELGQNLFHCDGDTWSVLRPHISPIFTSGKLKSMLQMMINCTDMFINYLDNANKTEYNIHALVQRYAISSIMACEFGINFNNYHGELDDTLKSVEKLVVTPNYRAEIDMMYPGLLKKLNTYLFPPYVRKFFDEVVSGILTQRNGKPSGRGDFMDLLLQLREMGEINNFKTKQEEENKSIEITNDFMVAQAFAFYIGGTETSTSTIAYLLYQIALNPKIQDKLREEIDTVTKAHGATQGEITYECLKDMKYLEKTFFETLRMYPIVDPVLRRAREDYKVPGTNAVLKKDQVAIVSILSIHHDEKYYPNPEVFSPDRFDSHLVGARHPCAYMPFGVGPRNCVGVRFGALQIQICIAKLISRFKVEISERTTRSLQISPQRITIGPKEGIFLNIIPRKS